MPNLNKIQIIGHAGGEPEMRFAPNGSPVTNLSVAVNSFRGKEKTEYTEWFKVVAFGKIAEQTNQYINKGNLVYVEGVCQLRKWTKQDGVEVATLEIIANKCLNLSPKNTEDYQGGEPKNADIEPEDLPF